MRGMGRRRGSGYRDSSDHLRHRDSFTSQGSHSTHDDSDNSSQSTAQSSSTPITSTPSALPCPILASTGHAFVGSSSSFVSTHCGGGTTSNDGGHTITASGNPTSSMDGLALGSGWERPRIHLVNGVLHPSDVCARKITSIFKERMDENGYCWKTVSKETKDFYWNEFQKHFVWDELTSSVIKMAWQRKAAERYRGLMCSLRKRKEKSMYIADSTWKIWNEAWNSSEFKSRSLQFTANRLTETGGPGSGISRHTGGSISHTCHAERLRSRLDRDLLPYELFEVTHTRKGTSELVDARSQAIKDRYLELVEQSSQTQEGDSEPPIINKTSLFYQAVGGEKKHRVYGLGSQAFVFYPQTSQRLSTGTSSEAVQTELRQLRQTLTVMEERDQHREQMMGKFMEERDQHREQMRQLREERDEFREQMMRQMRDMMTEFEVRFIQRSRSATQESLTTSDDDNVDHLDDL